MQWTKELDSKAELCMGGLVYDHRNLPQVVAMNCGAWLRRMWKEVAVAQFEVLTLHLLVRTENNHEGPQNSLYLTLDLNLRPSRYEGVLPSLVQ
jgi:hypothetical protein